MDVRAKNNCCCDDDFDLASVPESVCRVFDDELVVGGDSKRVFVSLGIFSIIKLERKVQLMIPSYDFCLIRSVLVLLTIIPVICLRELISLLMNFFLPKDVHF